MSIKCLILFRCLSINFLLSGGLHDESWLWIYDRLKKWCWMLLLKCDKWNIEWCALPWERRNEYNLCFLLIFLLVSFQSSFFFFLDVNQCSAVYPISFLHILENDKCIFCAYSYMWECYDIIYVCVLLLCSALFAVTQLDTLDCLSKGVQTDSHSCPIAEACIFSTQHL